MQDITRVFATRTGRMKASEIRELLKLLDRPGVISLAGGIPDPEMFPAEAFAAATARALSGPAAARSLQYSASEGDPGLRDWIVGHMAGLGVPCARENVLITSGSQQALDYLGKLLLSPGDVAMVGWPTYLGALGAFNAYEPCYARLSPHDNRDPAEIARDAGAGPGAALKLAYVTPDFANPTGITLPRRDRLALLAQARAQGIAIIEDAAYQALRYEGAPIPPILALELEREAAGDIDACRTIYCGSFSKTLAPGLRLGWVCAARPVIDKLVLLKQAGDLHSPTLNQIVLADVAAQVFDDHLPRLRAHYRARRDTMLAALADHMPGAAHWTRPEGGMFIWLTLPPEVDGAALLARALSQENLAFVPGAAFFPDGGGRNTVRLNFSAPAPAQIRDGIARLGRLLRQPAGAAGC